MPLCRRVLPISPLKLHCSPCERSDTVSHKPIPHWARPMRQLPSTAVNFIVDSFYSIFRYLSPSPSSNFPRISNTFSSFKLKVCFMRRNVLNESLSTECRPLMVIVMEEEIDTGRLHIHRDNGKSLYQRPGFGS